MAVWALASFAATAREEVDRSQLNCWLTRVGQATFKPKSISAWLRPKAMNLMEDGNAISQDEVAVEFDYRAIAPPGHKGLTLSKALEAAGRLPETR